MPTIRIDDEVWKALKQLAEPFEDTPNDVLRRVLNLRQADSAKKNDHAANSVAPTMRAAAATKVSQTPQSAYRLPIAKALVEMGGGAETAVVLRRVGEMMKDTLNILDLDQIPNGETRWQNQAKWERKNMVLEGFLKRDSRHGYWEITDKGFDLVSTGFDLASTKNVQRRRQPRSLTDIGEIG